MIDPLIIIIALICGLLIKRIGYPPMLGFLLAGFVASFLNIPQGEIIQLIADAGITLLLFSIGLKLNLRSLAKPQIWAVSIVHMVLSVLVCAALLLMLLPLLTSSIDSAFLDKQGILLVAFALSFSSTVFAVKVFDDRGESASLYAQIAIGVLIIQDLAAVIYLALSTGDLPQIWALLLLLLIPLQPLLGRLLKESGHGELLILYGIALAFGGYALFDVVGIKGDLGALLLGVLLAGSSKATELSKSLLGLKDLFLVGFFVSIGLTGVPSMSDLLLALLVTAIIVFKPVFFFLLFTLAKLRARTALFSSLALFNYSEFGLIVIALAVGNGVLDASWLMVLALALSLSFFIAVPINHQAHIWYNKHSKFLHRFERSKRLAYELPVNLGDAQVMVLGMGRVGNGVYESLEKSGLGKIVAVEENAQKVTKLTQQGINIVNADASDADFWEHIDLSCIRLITVNLTNHYENIDVVNLLHQKQFSGDIAVISRFPDEQKELESKGCIAFNLYAEAGHGFAEHVCEQLQQNHN